MFSKACTLAASNAGSLETLQLDPIYGIFDDALCTLGAREWPRLRSLSILCIPGTFSSYLKIDSMPGLKDLRLSGSLTSSDVAALARGRHFPSAVEVLNIFDVGPRLADDNDQWYGALKDLLQEASQLLTLKLKAARCRDLEFLAAPGLSSLEFLQMHDVPDEVALGPVTAVPKPHLMTLDLRGGTASAGDLEYLVSAGVSALPCLNRLCLGFKCDDLNFLGELRLERLLELGLHNWALTEANARHVGSALGRLPALASLEMHPWDENYIFNDVCSLVRGFLAGLPSPHPLRSLETGGNWRDSDESLSLLAACAHKLPRLQELCTMQAFISTDGFDALAAAGSDGAWPSLRLFRILNILGLPCYSAYSNAVNCDMMIQECNDVVKEVWPQLTVDIIYSGYRALLRR